MTRVGHEALIEDPEFVLPYTGLSDSYLALGFYHVMNFKEAGLKSKHYALRGLELDRNIGETHAAYATNILCFDWRWSEAEKEYLEAIRLNPEDVEAHHMYAHLLESTSRFDEAIKEMGQALEYLEKCFEDGDVYLFYIPIDAVFKELHSDPRFKLILKKMGLG